MWTRQDRQVAFWLVLASVLLFYFFIPLEEDFYGNANFSWSGFTNQTFSYRYEQSIWMSLYYIYIVLAGFALVVIAKRATGLAKPITYLSIGTIGLLGVPWLLHSVSARLMVLTVAFSCGAVLAGFYYRNSCRDSVPGWKYRTKVMFAALIAVLIIIAAVLHPTDTSVFLVLLLILFVNIAVLAFGLIGMIEAGSSAGTARIKLSKVVVISWFCVNLLVARYLQHINEFPGRIPLVVMYFRLFFFTLSSFMAITIGMIDLLKIHLLGKKPETTTTGSIQETTT